MVTPEGDFPVAPALVDNVETMANLPGILAEGADWFREIGTAESPGSIVCTVSGRTRRAGVVEVEMGTTLAEVIEIARWRRASRSPARRGGLGSRERARSRGEVRHPAHLRSHARHRLRARRLRLHRLRRRDRSRRGRARRSPASSRSSRAGSAPRASRMVSRSAPRSTAFAPPKPTATTSTRSRSASEP